MKELLKYFNNLNKEEREAFIASVDGLTERYFRRAISGGVPFSAARCVQIEKATNDAISRYDLRPDAKEIWG